MRTKQTAAKWRAGRVNRILRETVYRGEHIFTRFEAAPHGRKPGDGRSPRCAWQYSGGRRKAVVESETISRQFPALVEVETWHAAQRTLQGNRSLPRSSVRPYLLRGKIKCAACGVAFVGQSIKDYKLRGGHRHYYTTPRGKRARDRGVECLHKVVPADDLESMIWAEISAMLAAPDALVDEVLAELIGDVDSRSTLMEEIAEYRGRVRAKGTERENAIRLATKGIITDAELERQLAELDRERATLEGYVAHLCARVMDESEAADRARGVRELLDKHRGRVADNLSFETCRAIVDELLDCVQVETSMVEGKKRQTLTIVYRFVSPPSAPSAWASTSRTFASSHTTP
jgi:site-specific DNA recombinase